PDLQVTNVALTPASPQSGGTVTVSWNDTNTGSAATAGSWYDSVTVVNTTTGQTLTTAAVYYDAGALGALAVSAARARQYSFRPPDGDAAVGHIQVTVTADYSNNVFEYNSGAHATAEANNSAGATTTATLAAYADLQVANLSLNPANPQSGGTITVN